MRSPVLVRTFVLAVLPLATLAGCAAAGPPAAETAPPETRVGVYDSRAVAIAWYRSAEFRASMGELAREHARATESGDAARAAELEARAAARQEQAHRQGFGAAPIDDVLARVASDLPGVRSRAGVVALVSRWDPGAPAEGGTDVTDALVALFHPDAETGRVAREIRSSPPVADPSGTAND